MQGTELAVHRDRYVSQNNSLLLVSLVLLLLFLFSFCSVPVSFYTSDLQYLKQTALTHAHLLINKDTPSARSCAEKESTGECIHVVLSADGPYLLPLQTCINSIVQNTNSPVFLHLIVAEGEAGGFVRGLITSDVLKGTPLEIVEFNAERVRPLIRVWEGDNLEAYENPFNYARYYLPLLFPNVTNIIYLDPDTIVTVDISELLATFRAAEAGEEDEDKKPLLAASVAKADQKLGSVCHMLNCKDDELRVVVKDKLAPYFNAGVFVTNLARWKALSVTDLLEHWLRSNTIRKLWKWGSQGALEIVFYGRWIELDPSWNQRNSRKWISFVNNNDPEGLKTALATGKIFHFTTSMKPWTSRGNIVIWDLWCKYYPKSSLLWFCRKENRSPSPLSPLDYGFIRTLGL